MTALQLAFATDTVHPRDRFDLWHSVACRAYAQHECTTEVPTKFEGALRTARLAQATLSIYKNSPMDVWRTARQVERAPSDRVFICLQLDNVCRISQLGGRRRLPRVSSPSSRRTGRSGLSTRRDRARWCSTSIGPSSRAGSAPSVG